jgi:hypothetical protein
MIFGAKVGTTKRGDLYQNYAMSIEDFAANVGGGGSDPLEVLTTYPVTTPASAGTRFWYRGNEWHYMTQDEIDSTGWTGLVNVGFPAPVHKVYDEFILLNSDTVRYATAGSSPFNSIFPLFSRASSIAHTGICDIAGFGMPQYFSMLSFSGASNLTITEFKNAVLLNNLEDEGTTHSLLLQNLGLTDLVINSLFAQLPITTNVVTLNVSSNPGSLTCDPTIATAKGYTVIV